MSGGGDFLVYLYDDGTPRVNDRTPPPEWRSPRAQEAAARLARTTDDLEGSPHVPVHGETPASTRTPQPSGVERAANGRFRSAADPRENVHQPVGPDAATGTFDVSDVLRRLDAAEAAERRDARAWPKAVTASIAIIMVVLLVAFLAWLVVVGHVAGL